MTRSTGGRSSRTGDDHVHPDAWSKDDHHRYEDRMGVELAGIRQDLARLTQRVTLMIGAVGLLGFILPVLAPFVRAFLNLDTPAGQ